MNELMAPVELTDGELDLVAAGQNNQGAFGLVAANVGLTVGNVTVNALNGNTVDLTVSGNTVQVPIGVAVAALGGAAGVLNKLA